MKTNTLKIPLEFTSVSPIYLLGMMSLCRRIRGFPPPQKQNKTYQEFHSTNLSSVPFWFVFAICQRVIWNYGKRISQIR